MVRKALAGIAVALVAASASAQTLDLDRGARNYLGFLKGEIQLKDLSPAELSEVMAIYRELRKNDDEAAPSFDVTYSVRGCKYFVAEQNASYSLIDEWSCLRPDKGDVGHGDISSFGTKSVKLNGSCTLYVDDWLLSKSRAMEKLLDKCD